MDGKPRGKGSEQALEKTRLFSRFLAVLRREGSSGIYDRIRHPKPFWRPLAVPSPIRGPIGIRGGTPEERRQVERAFGDFGIEIATHDPSGITEVIHLGPDWPDAAQITDRDILAGTEPPDIDKMVALARRCRVLLTDCTATMSGLSDRGVPLEKIFFVEERARLHESMTRCLLALQNGSPNGATWRHFSALRDLPDRPRICLGLPETTRRRQSFLSKGLKNVILFDGIRRNPGWIGAGESFRIMAQACLDQGVERALFIEDDVELPPDFEQRFARIEDYLDRYDGSVFSGLITDVGPDYAVTRVERHDGETFAHLNRCVGMVFGLYDRKALSRIASWTPASGLTVDRHLEQADDLEVVTTLPFLAGHDDGLTSSIWRFSNRRYRRMIKTSEEKLRLMARDHEARRSSASSSYS